MKKFKIKLNNLIETFKEWAQNSSLHGIPNLVRNIGKSKFLQLLWILCILAAFCYGTLTLTKSMIEFFNYDVNTVVRIERYPSIEFPTV